MSGFDSLMLMVILVSISMLGVSVGFLIGFSKSREIYEEYVSEINKINDEYSKSVLESAIGSIENISQGRIKEFSEALVEMEKCVEEKYSKDSREWNYRQILLTTNRTTF